MRVLFDECVPKGLVRWLPGHDAWTVRRKKWLGVKNGALLAVMAGDGFEVLLTVDRSLRFQQNLTPFGVAVVVMVAPSNRLPDLVPLAPAVLLALTTIQPGDVVEVP